MYLGQYCLNCYIYIGILMYHGQYEFILGKRTVPSGECNTQVTFIKVSSSVLFKLLYIKVY